MSDAPRAIAVRDTKQAGREDRTVVRFTPGAWRKFTASVKSVK